MPSLIKKEASAKLATTKVTLPHLGKVNWETLHKEYKDQKALAYSMEKTFLSHNTLEHKTFGWGFVLSSKNNRLEVLFQSGVKHLISNYK